MTDNDDRGPIPISEANQRTGTIGPVNAHQKSGLTISTKTSFAKFDIVIR